MLYKPLMGICRRYENNDLDASALLNEGFYRILKNLKKYSNDKPFEPWARRVQINIVLDHYRKTRKMKAMTNSEALPEDIDLDSSTINEVEEKIEVEFLTNMMQALPEATKTVFYLHAVDGMDYGEICDALSLSKGTVKWHVFKAREVLKKQVEGMNKSVKHVV